MDRHQQFDQFIVAAYQQDEVPRLGSLGVLEPSWVFYARQPLEHLYVPGLSSDPDGAAAQDQRRGPWDNKPLQDAWQFLNGGSHHFVITTASMLEQLNQLPPGVEVVSRAPYFLRDDELVLLGNRGPLAARRPGRLPPLPMR